MQRGNQQPCLQGLAFPTPRLGLVPAPCTRAKPLSPGMGDTRSPGFTSRFGTELRVSLGFMQHPGRENRVWPSQPKVKGQEMSGGGNTGQSHPKSTYFGLATGPVRELQEPWAGRPAKGES